MVYCWFLASAPSNLSLASEIHDLRFLFGLFVAVVMTLVIAEFVFRVTSSILSICRSVNSGSKQSCEVITVFCQSSISIYEFVSNHSKWEGVDHYWKGVVHSSISIQRSVNI